MPAPSPSPPARHTRVTDSPWLWIFLFGVAALAALVVVGPRFARRQARLERMYEARTQAMRAAAEGRVEKVAEEPLERSRSGRGAPRIVVLEPLMLVVATLLLVAGVGIVVHARKRKGKPPEPRFAKP